MTSYRTGVAAALLAVTTLTGCDGGQGQELVDVEPAAAVQTLADGVRGDNDPGVGEPLITSEEADCFAQGLVDSAGVSQLQSQGVLTPAGEYAGLPQTASVAFAAQWREAFAECVDLPAYLVSITRTISTQVNNQLPTDDESWGRVLECVRDDVTPQEIARLYELRLTGQANNADPASSFNRCVGKLAPATS